MFQHIKHEKKDPKEVDEDIRKIAATLRNSNRSEIPADVMGSYTGTARDGDTPTQDADDL
jgi:hypothetical protein